MTEWPCVGSMVEYVGGACSAGREGSLTPTDVSTTAWAAGAVQSCPRSGRTSGSQTCRASASNTPRFEPATPLQLAAALAAADDEPGSIGFVCFDARLNEAASREGFATLES